MKIDNGRFYECDIEPVIDQEHFIELLLVTLAAREPHISDIIAMKNPIRTAKLPPNYKEQIEKVMYDENIFRHSFLQLIDHYQYYEKQSDWELSLAESFKKYLKNNNKKMNYNLEFDYIEVQFTDDEIIEILEKYDEQTQEIMGSLAIYIDNTGLERYHELLMNEIKRHTRRDYIATSSTNFSKTWTNTAEKEDKTAHITINPQYIKK